jgi:hypothetical protein
MVEIWGGKLCCGRGKQIYSKASLEKDVLRHQRGDTSVAKSLEAELRGLGGWQARLVGLYNIGNESKHPQASENSHCT